MADITKDDLDALEKRLISTLAIGAAIQMLGNDGAAYEDIMKLADGFERLFSQFASSDEEGRQDRVWEAIGRIQALRTENGNGNGGNGAAQ